MLKSGPTLRLAAACGMTLGLIAAEASGQAAGPQNDIFTAYGIPVDAEAETAARARGIALVRGQREGLAMVMRRLTLAADWNRLPAATDSQIAALVNGIQVEDEKTSSIRYLANLIIEFKKGEVRRLLRQATVAYTETRARPSLVLPLFAAAGRRQLFADDNAWLAAWAAHEVPYGSMFPLIIPIGDLDDVAAIDAEQALGGDVAALARIAARYGVANVVVAAADLVDRGGRPSIDLSLTWHGPLRSGTETSGLRALEDEDVGTLMARVVANTADRLEEEWKLQTLLRFDSENQLTARVPIAGLRDWIKVRERLDQNGMIRSYQIASISRQVVQINLNYLGEPEQLAVSLAQDSLSLSDEDGYWVLNLRSGAGTTATE